jgi:bacillithiol biosynthesis cysteine-adding enzyme BshC
MQKFTFHRKQTGFFSDQQNRLAYDQESLLPFIQRVFSKEAFDKQVELKRSSYSNNVRSTLAAVVREKYATVNCSEKTAQHVQWLQSDSTFTITTGHQLSLATGPIFSIYKVLHVIRMAEELNADNDLYKVVPVFWMASEDHDIEEVRSVDVFNSRLIWNTNEQGAVGRMSTIGLSEIKDQIRQLFQNQSTDQLNHLLDSWNGKTYGEAFFHLIHFLFDRFGLIIIDGDNKRLKAHFSAIMKREILEKPSFRLVTNTNEHLQKEGAKIQVNPREINVFYLSNGTRDRIVEEDNKYRLNADRLISEKEVMDELDEYPERFSPNVILRPVYQETVLPNLCYLGGVGEIAYWIQLKAVFDEYTIQYPLITPRVSILWIDSVTSKKMAKINLSVEDLFREVSTVKKDMVMSLSDDQFDFSKVDVLMNQLTDEFNAQAKLIDLNAERMSTAELVKVTKQVELIKDKLLKFVKQQHESSLNQIDQVFGRLFPDGSLQERKMNVLTICPTGAIHERIEQLHQFIDPFDMDFIVLKE